MTATEAQLEVLNDAHQALLGHGDFMDCADPRAHIRASNRLLDACIDAGMPYDHADYQVWAATRVWLWLNSGPVAGLWAGSGYARNYAIGVPA